LEFFTILLQNILILYAERTQVTKKFCAQFRSWV